MQRQGTVSDTARALPDRPERRVIAPEEERQAFGARIGEYFREVRNELVKVAWPPRSEVINYSTVVLVTLVVIVLVIFGLNWMFGHLVIWLYGRPA
jgi:preprotein translocase subunit SecE